MPGLKASLGLAFAFWLASATASAEPGLSRGRLKFSPSVAQYARQEVTFQLARKFANPYDPREIAVVGLFSAPSGRLFRVPGFFHSRHDAILNAPGEESSWKLRFAPSDVGQYTLAVSTSYRGGVYEEIGAASFECVPSEGGGYVGRAGRHFVLSSGEGFFPIGANRCWGDLRDPSRYLIEMERLAASGANCLRVWLAPWWLPIEWRPGVYNQGASARLDGIIEKAESLGLRVILCIEQHGNLQPKGADVGQWGRHPYNVANGGPCVTRTSFFTDVKAMHLFRRRLRYLVARWGYSPALMAWELFNEVEWVGFEDGGLFENEAAVEAWHRAMSTYLRRTDPFGHLVATSSDVHLQQNLLTTGDVDFVQVHFYERQNLVGELGARVGSLRAELVAPVLVGEFGPGAADGSAQYVTRGIFASAFSGTGAGALPWLQDTADAGPSYERLAAARDYFEEVRWRKEGLEPVQVEVEHRGSGGDRDEQKWHGGDRGRRWDAGEGLHILALKGESGALVFAYARSDSRGGGTDAVRLRIPGLGRGKYSVEVWDLATGSVTDRHLAVAEEPGLSVTLRPFKGEVALKMTLLHGVE